MNRLIEFIKRIYFILIFIILEIVAYNLYAKSSVYVNAQHHNASNDLLGGVYDIKCSIVDFFSLKEINNNLMDENARLRERISLLEDLNIHIVSGGGVKSAIVDSSSNFDSIIDTIGISPIRIAKGEVDTMLLDSMLIFAPTLQKDKYIPARVMNNTVSRLQNFITLNCGSLDSIAVDMPVVCNDAIVGYVVAVSNNYSIVLSVLNTNFKTGGMLKNDGSICSVYWRGERSDEIEFSGINKYAKINIGDTIVTTGFSSYFTPNKLIGKIVDFKLEEQMYYKGKLKLFTNFEKLHNVQIIIPENINERRILEDTTIYKSINNQKLSVTEINNNKNLDYGGNI